MYESFFRLVRRPFLSTPNRERYFPNANSEHVRLTLIRCAELAQGPALLLGGAGTGKSLVCELIADHFRNLPDRFRVVMLGTVRATNRRELLQTILFELGLPYRDMAEGELQLSLLAHLQAVSTNLVLIVDEAHLLSLRLLEELRILSNLADQGDARVRLVLSGGIALDEKLSQPRLASFQQRIAARCCLQPLNRDEIDDYLRQQMRAAGASAEAIFSESACDTIARTSDGIPRRINQICDYAMLLASLAGRAQIDAHAIEEAWADLQQLPGPWQAVNQVTEDAQTVIEFGALDVIESVAVESPESRSHALAEQLEQNLADAIRNEFGEQQALTAAQDVDTGATATATPLKQAELVTVSVPEDKFALAPEAASAAIVEQPAQPALPLDLTGGESYRLATESAWGWEIDADDFVTRSVCETDLASESSIGDGTTTPGFDGSAMAASGESTPASIDAASDSLTTVHFPDLTDTNLLFGDGFHEEEVILDHFAAFGPEALQDRPRVSFPEGREWAAALAAAAAAAAAGPPGIEPSSAANAPATRIASGDSASTADHEIAGVDLPAAEPNALFVERRVFDPATDPVFPEPVTEVPWAPDAALRRAGAWPGSDVEVGDAESALLGVSAEVDPDLQELTNSVIDVASVVEEAIWPVEPVGPGPAASRPAPISDDDRDLLIIHEDGPAAGEMQSRARGRARRQEYRQLFARLRRRIQQ